MSTTTTHTAAQAGRSQCAKILQRLRATPGEWVSEPELLLLSGSHAVHARIGDLRKRGSREGFAIHNRCERVVREDGSPQIHSSYRIEFFDADAQD